jgi:hypothetical protein
MSACYAAELVWDEERASRFRQMCREYLGRDCVCQEGESCALMGAALDLLDSDLIRKNTITLSLIEAAIA